MDQILDQCKLDVYVNYCEFFPMPKGQKLHNDSDVR